MPIKLLVTRSTDASPPDEYVFDQDAFTIGRDSSNQLTLPDLKRVVSKQHAELRWDDGSYRLTDLGSKNFTYLNDERLQSGKPYEVRFGDSIKIGDFEIRLEPVQAPAANHDATVFDVSFVNPFADDVSQLAEALRNISEAYQREAPSRREDALLEALQDEFSAETTTAYDLVGAILSPSAPSAPSSPSAPSAPRGASEPPAAKHRASKSPASETPASEPPPLEPGPSKRNTPDTPAARPPRTATPPVDQDSTGRSRPAPATGYGDTPTSRIEAVLGVLVHVAARLVNIPWQFRHEFIGQTIMQSAESAAVYSGDADALREYVLDTRISEDEAERRLDLLAKAGEEVALHQVAMLDGYRAGALEGTKRLLNEIDPEAAEAAAKQEGGLNRILAFRASDDALELLKRKLQELKSEDWSIAERRIFRPAFIKAYLARMTSTRK